MTRHERVSVDIHMTFDWIRHLVAHPDELDPLPDRGVVRILSTDRPEEPEATGEPTITFVAKRSFRRVPSAA